MSRSAADPAVAVAVALALVLSAGLATVGTRRTGDRPVPAAGVVAPAPAPGATPSPGAAPAPEVLAALEERIRPLGGRTTRLDDAERGLGPLDAERLVALAEVGETDRAAALRRLELLGFSQALARGWRSPQGRELVVVVARLATPQAAEDLVADLRARLPGTPFRSTAVPDAVASSTERAGAFEQRAAFARGPYAYQLTFTTPEEDDDSRLFELLLGRQAAHAQRLDP